MRNLFLSLKEKFARKEPEIESDAEDYVELGHEGSAERSKIIVRRFVLDDFDDIRHILDALREGVTIALINMQPLKEKDMVELKRAINKLKKTCDAIEGDIMGFGDDYIVAVPGIAQIYRANEAGEAQESAKPEAQSQQ